MQKIAVISAHYRFLITFSKPSDFYSSIYRILLSLITIHVGFSKNKEELRATYAGICCCTVGSVQYEISQSRTYYIYSLS